MARAVRTVTHVEPVGIHVAVHAGGKFTFFSGKPRARCGVDVLPTDQKLTPLGSTVALGSTVRVLRGVKLALLPAALPDLLRDGVDRDDALRAHARLLGALQVAELVVMGVPFPTRLLVGDGIELLAVGSSHPQVLAGVFKRGVLEYDYERVLAAALLVADEGKDVETARRETQPAEVKLAEVWIPNNTSFDYTLSAPPVPGYDPIRHDDRVLCVFDLTLEFSIASSTVLDPRFQEDRSDRDRRVELTPEQQKTLDDLVGIVKKRRHVGDSGVSVMGQYALDTERTLTEAGVPLWQVRETVKAEVDKLPYWLVRVGTDLGGNALYMRYFYDKQDAVVTNQKELAVRYYVEEQAVEAAGKVGGKVDLVSPE